jgi:hypothetical protein
MRILINITIVILQTWSSYSQCPCNEIQLDSALSTYKNIMSVELISKSKNNQRFDKNQLFPKGIINEFKIFGVFKGKFSIGDTVSCLTGNGKEDNGYIFEIGEKYILFYENYIDKCSPTQVYSNELNDKLDKKLPPNIPPVPPPPPGYTSTLWKYELNSTYYWHGLRAEIINEDIEQILVTLNSKIESLGEIPKNSLITIILNDQSQVIKSRVVSINQKTEIGGISNELKGFIEKNMKFRTEDENCLIENSNWVYRYE